MVLDIHTVLPEDTEQLTIDPNRDSCTLVTCTPYGVNTHRLLVRGERIEYETAVSIVEETPVEDAPLSTWTEEYLRGVGLGLIGVAGITTAAGILWLRPKRKKKQIKSSVQTVPRTSHIHWESVQPLSQPPARHKRSEKKSLRLFPKRRRGKHEKR